MSTRAATMTADELWMLPDDGMRHELLAGRLTVMEPTGFEHGRVAGDVFGLLREHVRDRDLGVTSAAETGFVIGRNPDTVRAPDAAFVTKQRYEALGSTDRFWPEAPAFSVEVLSPGDTTAEVQAKAFAWRRRHYGCARSRPRHEDGNRVSTPRRYPLLRAHGRGRPRRRRAGLATVAARALRLIRKDS